MVWAMSLDAIVDFFKAQKRTHSALDEFERRLKLVWSIARFS